ncbi:MAG TPA: helix-turn-helix transcriptional regulator [Puia sp.]|uniref:helix-turn-helix domain-containing protein n=1 Tax=Puia sp. TaxID=2045100 RepID=UPI002CA6D862|nr:helix-turn-helix transcriptional regulator [Puia sp.]HVU94844.1 helix-turn-helix transcriptional regulator [Puia sp.]
MSKQRSRMQELAKGNESGWHEDAIFRRTNKWLSYSSEIALRILAAIEDKKDFSQSRLAELLNVSPQQVSKIVKGKENLTLETIYNISKALDVSLISFPEYKYSQPLMGAPFQVNQAKVISFPPFVKAEGVESPYPMGKAQ